MKYWNIATGELVDPDTQTLGEKFSIAGMDRDLNIPTKVADLADDLTPGPLKDELLGNFDPNQETWHEYKKRISIPIDEYDIAGGKEGGLMRKSYNPGGPVVSLGLALGRPVVLRALAAMGITAATAQKMAEENPSMLNNILANLFSGRGELDPSAVFEDKPTEGPEVEKVEEDVADWTLSFKDEKPPKLPEDPVLEVLQDVVISELIDKYRKSKTKKGSTQPTMKDSEKTELINKVVDTFKKQHDRLPAHGELKRLFPTWGNLSEILRAGDIKILSQSEYRALPEVKEKAKEAKLNPKFLAERRRFFQHRAEQDKTITIFQGKVSDPNVVGKDAEAFFPKTITVDGKEVNAKQFFIDNLIKKIELGSKRAVARQETYLDKDLADLFNTTKSNIGDAKQIIQRSSDFIAKAPPLIDRSIYKEENLAKLKKSFDLLSKEEQINVKIQNRWMKDFNNIFRNKALSNVKKNHPKIIKELQWKLIDGKMEQLKRPDDKLKVDIKRLGSIEHLIQKVTGQYNIEQLGNRAFAFHRVNTNIESIKAYIRKNPDEIENIKGLEEWLTERGFRIRVDGISEDLVKKLGKKSNFFGAPSGAMFDSETGTSIQFEKYLDFLDIALDILDGPEGVPLKKIKMAQGGRVGYQVGGRVDLQAGTMDFPLVNAFTEQKADEISAAELLADAKYMKRDSFDFQDADVDLPENVLPFGMSSDVLANELRAKTEEEHMGDVRKAREAEKETNDYLHEGFKEKGTLQTYADVLNPKNIPYYVAAFQEGVVEGTEWGYGQAMKMGQPGYFKSGKGLEEYFYQTKMDKMKIPGLGQSLEEITADYRAKAAKEGMSPSVAKAAGWVKLGGDVVMPLFAGMYGASVAGTRFLSNVPKFLGNTKIAKDIEKLASERFSAFNKGNKSLTSFGEGRRDFNRLLAGTSFIGMFKVLGLDKLFKFTPAVDKAGTMIKVLKDTTSEMPDWFPAFVAKLNNEGKLKYEGDGMYSMVDDAELPGITVYKEGENYTIVGKNEYEQEWIAHYEAPHWLEPVDGKEAVKFKGDFEVKDNTPYGHGPEGDFDVELETLRGIDHVLGGNAKTLEEWTTGIQKKEMTIGEVKVSDAELRYEINAERAREEGLFDENFAEGGLASLIKYDNNR